MKRLLFLLIVYLLGVHMNLNAENKILVAYFSKTGNTRTVAEHIHKAVGGDIFEIVPTKPYTKGYLSTVVSAKMEQIKKARPEISTKVSNFEQYDIIFLGYPNWWNTMPLILNTFLESYDFAGKTIVPFATHGGGGMGKSVKDIEKSAPKSTILEGLAVHAKEINSSQSSVTNWLNRIEMLSK